MKTTTNSKGELFATITIETKKGETQDCIFFIHQARPYPSLTGYGIEWQGDDAILFSHYGNQPSFELPKKYHVALLKTDIDIENLEDSRRDHAGFTERDYKNNSVFSKTNPGTIVYRGNDLGEMDLTIERNAHHPKAIDGLFLNLPYDTFTPGQRDFIVDALLAGLVKAIKKNEKALNNAAKKDLKAHMLNKLEEAKKALKSLEAKTKDALKKLK